jgi:hypothetical protein
MARLFNGSSDSAHVALDLSNTNIITISFWLYWNAFANNDALAMEYSSNFNTNPGGFLVDPNNSSPSPGTFTVGISGGGETVAVFTRPSAAVWHQYVLTINHALAGSSAIPNIYVDGVAQSLTYPFALSAPQNFGNFTLNFMSRATTSLFGAGRMADFALWQGVLLTQLEAQGLALGTRPYMVRPASLRAYFPMDGIASPEPDMVGPFRNNLLLTGTSRVFGPPVGPYSPGF